jgi:hypothetical protein
MPARAVTGSQSLHVTERSLGTVVLKAIPWAEPAQAAQKASVFPAGLAFRVIAWASHERLARPLGAVHRVISAV